MRNPLRLRQLSVGLVAVAALLVAVATWQRNRLTPGTSAHSATAFLDVFGWFLVIIGAIIEAKIGDLLLNAQQMAARRRALFLTCLGLGSALTACITITGQSASAVNLPMRIVLSGLLVGGIGFGLGGTGTLIWFYGSRYAANRVAKLGEEDW